MELTCWKFEQVVETLLMEMKSTYAVIGVMLGIAGVCGARRSVWYVAIQRANIQICDE